MKKTVRVCACINEISPLNPVANLASAIEEIRKNIAAGIDLMVLPPLFLTGGELAGLSDSENLFAECEVHLQALARAFSKERFGILAGIPAKGGAALAFISGGRVRYGKNSPLTFDVQGNRCMAVHGMGEGLSYLAQAATANTDILFFCDYSPAIAGHDKIIENNLMSITKTMGTSCCFVRGGRADTSHPNVYRAAAAFCRTGDDLQFFAGDAASGASASLGGVLSESASAVIDLPQTKEINHPIKVQKNPFIPTGMRDDTYCLDVFDLQCRSLASRLKNLGLQKVVVGVSGGLDSCLALLVCAGAMDILGLPRSGIIALMMPGFGTSEGTLQTSKELCEAVNATSKIIDIVPSCRAVFQAMGHDENKHDVVFENVQARQRTAIALSVGNAEGAIMVGTGDLSEEALGFSTYGGDQLAGYNVNVCIPKTLVRVMLPIITREPSFVGLSLCVQNVLQTPVSPELLPLENGEIVQRTEEILAPYELLDFFLYCFIAARLSKEEILEAAGKYFAGEFTAEYMQEKLDMFFKRFISGQFKRSCAPEAARITSVNLLSGGLWVPSDMKPDIFIK